MGGTNKKISEKDKEETEWGKIDKVEKRLTYQNLKDTWKKIKPKIETIINERQLDYTKLEVQQVLSKNNIDIPEIVTINGLNKIQYPIFCKENSHVGINLVAYSENTLVKFFCKFNISDFYCEKIITGGKEMKLYCINNIVYDNNEIIKNKELNELFKKITNSLQIETYSADIINKENKNIVIDINPNSGFFSSNIARKEFLKYVISCSKDIIHNYIL